MESVLLTAEFWRVRLDHRKACRRIAEVWRVRFDTTKRVGGLWMLRESVLITSKREAACRALES